MGAGASVISKNEEETKATSQDQGNVTKTIAPAKAPPKEGAAVNGKSKFPSAKSSAQRPEVKMTPNVINKEHSPDIYNVEIAADVPCINVLKVSTVYRLRVSVESLDILREGTYIDNFL